MGGMVLETNLQEILTAVKEQVQNHARTHTHTHTHTHTQSAATSRARLALKVAAQSNKTAYLGTYEDVLLKRQVKEAGQVMLVSIP